jgi:Bacterial type II and III secretion system protein
MSQGLRMLLAAAALAVVLPMTRAAEPETQVTCQVWVVRVSDECFDRLRTMGNCSGAPCQACPTCPHAPCEQKCATAACREQKCCSEKAGGKSRCEQMCCDAAKSCPATLPTVLDARQVTRMLDMVRDQAGCDILSSPQITTLMGQTGTIQLNSVHFFVTKVQSTKVNGQTVFVPNNEQFPVGFRMKVEPTMTPDRAAVIMNLDAQVTDLDTPTAPLYPIATTITPVFEGGAQGQPVAFTQFIQQPSFTTRGVHKFVACSNGQSIVLDCGRRTTCNETVSEVPVLSDLPVIGELFRSKSTEVACDRLLVFVTPQVKMVEGGEESSVETGSAEMPLFAQPIMCEEAARPIVEYLPIAPRPVCAPPAMACPPCMPCPVQDRPPVSTAPIPPSAGSGGYIMVHPMQAKPAVAPAAIPTTTMQPAVAVAAVTAATPPMMIRQVAAVAQPCCPSAESQLVQLMIEYHEACAAGDRLKARNLAARCIALDPTCFGR